MDDEATGFEGRLERRANAILDLLSRPRWRLARGVPRDPEVRKSLDRLYTAISEVLRLEREGGLEPEGRVAARKLLDLDPAGMSADALGLHLETVDRFLVSVGDEALVCALLEIEYARDRVEGGGPIPTWSTLYPPGPIAASREFAAGGDVSRASLTQAKQRLSALYRARHAVYALGRARNTAKAFRLLLLAPLVVALVAVLVAVVDVVADDVSWRRGLLVALAGALGATIAGAYKLRDQLPRLADLRIFWYAFALQPPLGAAAGLFLWIVLLSGLVQVADVGADWAVETAVAFAAGFSEPVLLKTIERIVGVAEPKSS